MIIVDPLNNVVTQPEGRKTLTLLVRRYPGYRNNRDVLYSDFAAVLLAAASDAADTKALNAVLAQLLTLPLVVVDSEGSDQQRVFFSVVGNWEELAQTVLDILYEPQGDSAAVFFGSADRGLPDGCYAENIIFLDERRYT